MCCSTTWATFRTRSRSIGTTVNAITRDYVHREAFEQLVRRLGIDDTTTVVLYGDKNNWWATYAFWVFRLFGFENLKILDGGRIKWEQEGRRW